MTVRNPDVSVSASGWSDADRRRALARYRILDTPREEQFDDIAELAAAACDAPIAVVNFIDSDRQWFKAEIGIGQRELPLDASICRHALLGREILVVSDLQADARFTGNPLVHVEGGLRFYAGALLLTPEGLPIGTVCVLDHRPRPAGVTERQQRMLLALARQVMSELELRRRLAEEQDDGATARRAETSLRETEERYRLASRATNDAIWDWDLATDEIRWNEAVQVLFGYTADEVGGAGSWWKAHIHPDDRDRVVQSITAVIAGTGERWTDEYRFLRHDGSAATVFDRGFVLRDASGRAVRMVGAMLDVTEPRRAEQALRESEDRLRVAQAAGRIGTFELLPATGRILVSEEFCRLWGAPKVAEVPVTFFLDRIHPEDRERVVTGRAELPERALDYIEYRVIREDDGETRWMARRGEAAVDPATGIRRYLGVTYDITERKAAEDALKASELRLRESETRFRQIADLAPAITWFGRPDGTLTYLNAHWHDYTGQTPEEALPTGWAKAIHPDDVPQVDAAWGKARVEGLPYEQEARLRRHDGAYRWFLMRAVALRDRDGRITGWLGNDSDIHDRKSAELAMADLNVTLERRVSTALAERKLWADMFETSDALIGALGPDHRFLALNRAYGDAFVRLCGVRPAVGDSLPEILAHLPEVRSAVLAVWDRALAGEEFSVAEPFDDPDRAAPYYERRFNPLRDREGRFIGAFQYGVDITDRLRDHARLAETEEQLRQAQKMEAVGQLTGGIAHDFNNLLTGVIGSLDLMQRRIAQGQTDKVERYATAAMTSANRAAALTHRLLAFSRRQPLDPKPVQANRLVTGMEELLRRTIGETIRLEIVTAGGLWLTQCDPHQLESAILNLAINARDAMPGGGTLTIETCNAHLDSAYSARSRDVKPGQYVCICVTDTGTGMAPEIIKKAFDPFFTTKPIGHGTGLGLSMIYGFARQSEGYAKIYSEVGQGSTIKLYLPRFYGPGATVDDGERASGEERRSHDGEVVLVVEDETAVRDLVVDVLGELGYRTVEAADGPSGLQMLQSDMRIDLLLTDIGLPGLNGRDLADAARRGRPDLKILFMTGYAENATVANGFLDPGMEMITKPFAIDALVARIRDMLEGEPGRHAGS